MAFKKSEIKASPLIKRTKRCRVEKWPNVETELNKWILLQRSLGRSVSTVSVGLQARLIASNMKIDGFTGYPSWCYRFMKRNHLSVRAKTTVGQQLPEEWEVKAKEFQKFVDKIIKEEDLLATEVINMDEIALSFDMVPNRTVNLTGTLDLHFFFVYVLYLYFDGKLELNTFFVLYVIFLNSG